jgi:hypothetical protein
MTREEKLIMKLREEFEALVLRVEKLERKKRVKTIKK